MPGMTVVHYTSVPQLYMIVDSNTLRTSRHQGYDERMISLCPEDCPKPNFVWNVGVKNEWFSKGMARIVLDIPEKEIKSWVDTCSEPNLIALTKKHEPHCDKWLVCNGPLDISNHLIRYEVCVDGEWLTTTKETLKTMLSGYRFSINNRKVDF